MKSGTAGPLSHGKGLERKSWTCGQATGKRASHGRRLKAEYLMVMKGNTRGAQGQHIAQCGSEHMKLRSHPWERWRESGGGKKGRGKGKATAHS